MSVISIPTQRLIQAGTSPNPCQKCRLANPPADPPKHILPGFVGHPDLPPGETDFAVVVLNDEERKRVFDTAISSPDPVHDAESAFLYADEVRAALPKHVRQAIQRWKMAGRAPGMLILRNTPTDPELPPTPTDGRAASGKRTFVTEAVLLAVAGGIGEVYGYAAERSGDLIHNTAPMPTKADSPSSSGSKNILEAHTEVTAGRFRRCAPEYLCLAFLRGDPLATTLYADARAIQGRLTDEEQKIVRASEGFRSCLPASFVSGLGGGYDERVFSGPHPVLLGPEDSPEIIFDAGGTEALSPEGEGVLDRIKDLLLDPTVFRPAVGGPGDLFVLNNRRGIHGRNKFSPVFNGSQRWPMRVYVSSPSSLQENREHFDPIRRVYETLPLS